MKEVGKKALAAAPYVAKGAAIGAIKGTKAVFQGAGMLGKAIAAATEQKSTQNDTPIQKRKPATPQQRERQPVARPLVFKMSDDDDDEPESRHENKGKRGRPRKV
jgi:hypothetical protein